MHTWKVICSHFSLDLANKTFDVLLYKYGLILLQMDDPVCKEKKRRKLDEIVLGLSAAKEQSLFADMKKSISSGTSSSSLTITTTAAATTSAPSKPPFSLTITSVSSPGTSKLPDIPTAKENFNLLSQMEQNILKKAQPAPMMQQQQQQPPPRKSYESLLSDVNKIADFSSKIGSFSHEAKVSFF